MYHCHTHVVTRGCRGLADRSVIDRVCVQVKPDAPLWLRSGRVQRIGERVFGLPTAGNAFDRPNAGDYNRTPSRRAGQCTMLKRPARGVIVACLLLSPMAVAQSRRPASWLDGPLTNWNKAGQVVANAPKSDEAVSDVLARCRLMPLRATSAERTVESAGWIPFLYFDQGLARDDVAIVAGMRGADGMCRPGIYNLFVFVDGRFAGALPTAMTREPTVRRRPCACRCRISRPNSRATAATIRSAVPRPT